MYMYVYVAIKEFLLTSNMLEFLDVAVAAECFLYVFLLA